jgi:hypothetical protein
MTSTVILSDNGVSSGSAGLKSQGGNDGILLLQTTTAGGTVTTAVTIDNSQNVLVGMSSYGVTNAGVSLSPIASSSFYVAGGTALTVGRGASDGTAVQFNRSGTNVGTLGVATTGISMTGVNGITFTAAQTASSDANTLDDYEEGTWTPNQGAGVTLTGAFTSNGTYTKIGRQVYARAYMNGATNIAVSSAGVVCTNLPFSAVADACGSATNGSVNLSSSVYASTTTVYNATIIPASNGYFFSVSYTAAT